MNPEEEGGNLRTSTPKMVDQLAAAEASKLTPAARLVMMRLEELATKALATSLARIRRARDDEAKRRILESAAFDSLLKARRLGYTGGSNDWIQYLKARADKLAALIPPEAPAEPGPERPPNEISGNSREG